MTLRYLSTLELEWNKLDAASDLAQKGLDNARYWGQMDVLITCHLNLAIVLQAKGETEAATQQAILHDTAEPLTRYKSGMSEDLQRIVEEREATEAACPCSPVAAPRVQESTGRRPGGQAELGFE